MTEAKSGRMAPHYAAAFVLTTSLFFLWAIGHSLNDVLVREFERSLTLTRFQASFVQFFFYIAYFVVALPAGAAMHRFGFKRTMILGLVLLAIGALGFLPAAAIGRFAPFLGALFVLASGIIFLEISASAFIVLTGAAERSAFRINLAQGFNGVGAVVGPLIGGAFILSGTSPVVTAAISADVLEAARRAELLSVRGPYTAIAIFSLLIATLIAITPFPAEARSCSGSRAADYVAVLREPRFLGAAIGEFFYVGAQVSIWSFFIDFARNSDVALSDRQSAFLLSGSLVLFAAGRFSGALLMRFVAPQVILRNYAILAAGCIVLSRMLGGDAAIAALMCTSFFMSVMYPTLFDMGVKASGDRSHIGAAIMVMTIAGGALVPPLMGLIADRYGIRSGYLLMVLNFAVIAAVAYRNTTLRASVSSRMVS